MIKFIVKYVDYDLPLSVSQITTLCRIGSKTNKTLMLASVLSDGRPVTRWVRPTDRRASF